MNAAYLFIAIILGLLVTSNIILIREMLVQRKKNRMAIKSVMEEIAKLRLALSEHQTTIHAPLHGAIDCVVQVLSKLLFPPTPEPEGVEDERQSTWDRVVDDEYSNNT